LSIIECLTTYATLFESADNCISDTLEEIYYGASYVLQETNHFLDQITELTAYSRKHDIRDDARRIVTKPFGNYTHNTPYIRVFDVNVQLGYHHDGIAVIIPLQGIRILHNIVRGMVRIFDYILKQIHQIGQIAAGRNVLWIEWMYQIQYLTKFANSIGMCRLRGKYKATENNETDGKQLITITDRFHIGLLCGIT
jgi:hypothetical protein